MKYYDISLNLSTDTVRWVVAPPLEVHERRRMSRGDDVNASALTVSVRAGTHLDAPFDFLPDGAGILSTRSARNAAGSFTRKPSGVAWRGARRKAPGPPRR